jgi:hypothetical protein
MAQEPLLSLALPKQSAPFDVAQVDVVAQEAPSTWRLLTARTISGSGLFQADDGSKPTCAPQPTGRHGLRLGEHFRIGTDAHFHVLRPGATLLQLLLQALRRLRAGTQGRQIAAQSILQRAAQAGGTRRVAARLLLDHALEQADGERHAAGLDRLQIAWRQQQRPIRRRLQRLRHQRLHWTERGARRMAGDAQRIVALEQLGHGGDRFCDVDDFTAAHGDNARAIAPDAANQGGLRQVDG